MQARLTAVSRRRRIVAVKFRGRPRLNRDPRFAFQRDRIVQARQALALKELVDVRRVPAEIFGDFRLHEPPTVHPVLELFGSVVHDS